MAEYFPTPAAMSTAAADALGGTIDERTAIAYLQLGVSPQSSPTLSQQQNRIEHAIRRALAGIVAGMAVKTATLQVDVYPFRYRKADGTAVHYEGGSIALTASQTNYLYILHGTNALTKDTASFPGDETTFTPIAEYVCDGSDITTADDAADRRGLVLFHTNATSSSPTGTTATSFTTDNDNAAGAGADQQYRCERGTDDAEDAALEWDETNNRWNVLKQHSTRTACPLNASALMVAGSDVLDSSGDLVAAAIKTTLLYVFGANGATPYGVKLTPGGGAAPAGGAHTVGELAVDTNGIIYVCTGAGTPGTWIQIGKQDARAVLSVGNGAAAAPGAATCTIQVVDGSGDNKAATQIFDVYLMNDDEGAAEAGNCGAFTVTTGSAVRTITADKIYRVKTDANGTLVFTVTNTIPDSVYVLCLPAPGTGVVNCVDHGTLTFT